MLVNIPYMDPMGLLVCFKKSSFAPGRLWPPTQNGQLNPAWWSKFVDVNTCQRCQAYTYMTFYHVFIYNSIIKQIQVVFVKIVRSACKNAPLWLYKPIPLSTIWHINPCSCSHKTTETNLVKLPVFIVWGILKSSRFLVFCFHVFSL